MSSPRMRRKWVGTECALEWAFCASCLVSLRVSASGFFHEEVFMVSFLPRSPPSGDGDGSTPTSATIDLANNFGQALTPAGGTARAMGDAVAAASDAGAASDVLAIEGVNLRDSFVVSGTAILGIPSGVLPGPALVIGRAAGTQTAADPRPDSAAFFAAYKPVDYSTIPSQTQNDPHHQIEVWKIIGGNVGKFGEGPTNNSNVQNSCAARMSYGLNSVGVAVKGTGASKNFVDQKDRFGKSGDGDRYILSAARMQDFLTATFGAPTKTLNTAEDVKAFAKTLAKGQCAIFACQGHTGVITDSTNDYLDPYVLDEVPVVVWTLPVKDN